MRALLIQRGSIVTPSVLEALAQRGWAVDAVTWRKGACDFQSSGEYDLILFDFGRSSELGLSTLDALRSTFSKTPLVVLSGVCDRGLMLSSFKLGVDDFVEMPIHDEEFLARVDAIVRRSKGRSGPIIHHGPISLDLDSKTVSLNGSALFLTEKEYAVFELLLLRRGQPITKEDFLDHLYAEGDRPSAERIDKFVFSLRRKLLPGCGEDVCIEVNWGKGYSLQKEKVLSAY